MRLWRNALTDSLRAQGLCPRLSVLFFYFLFYMSLFGKIRDKIRNKKKNKKAKGGKTISPVCSAVIAAAGSSERMNGKDKLFSQLGGMPVIARSLLAFEKSPHIKEIVVVTSEANLVPIGDICRDYNITKAQKIVVGGETREQSVLKGLMELSKGSELVAIHDGARPLVTGDLITNTIWKAAKYSAAIPAVRLTDTVKTAENGIVSSTPDRNTLFSVQTPQVFETSLIKGALSKALKEGTELTDDSSAVERLGCSVHIVPGSEENLKITYPSDLIKAEAIIAARKAGKL